MIALAAFTPAVPDINKGPWRLLAGHMKASIITSSSGDPVALIHWTWSDIVQINVWLSRAAVEDVSVNWQTVDDTALAGVDYTDRRIWCAAVQARRVQQDGRG